MDGRHFDRLANTLARGASRRSALKGLLAGTVGGAFSQLRVDLAHAQCSWSGIFQTTFGDMIVTLNESGGQVTGSYTFTENTATTNGTISGTVRTDSPGSTVLDGTWREPGQGGQLRFTMALDPCTEFTGSYTTDPSEAWKPGWDGVRSDGDAAGTLEVTLFTNPGDTRVAEYTVEGRVVTVFGPKDANGLGEYIDHAQVDPPDGDPQKRGVLDFAEDGAPTRAALGSGEMLNFEWVSSARVIVTYQSADGSQLVQFPIEAAESADAAKHAQGGTTQAHGGSQVGMVAYSGRSYPGRLQGEPRAALPSAQAPVGSFGVINVQCAGGQLTDAEWVTGYFRIVTKLDTGTIVPMAKQNPVEFKRIAQGVYSYSLPLAPAPADAAKPDPAILDFILDLISKGPAHRAGPCGFRVARQDSAHLLPWCLGEVPRQSRPA